MEEQKDKYNGLETNVIRMRDTHHLGLLKLSKAFSMLEELYSRKKVRDF